MRAAAKIFPIKSFLARGFWFYSCVTTNDVEYKRLLRQFLVRHVNHDYAPGIGLWKAFFRTANRGGFMKLGVTVNLTSEHELYLKLFITNGGGW